MALSALASAEQMFQADRTRIATADLAQKQFGYRKELQEDKFNFDRKENISNRNHTLRLEDRRQQNAIKIENLRKDASIESQKLQDRFRKENFKIETEINLINRLEEMGAADAYARGRDATGQQYAIALQNNANALTNIGREDQQAHELAKQALQNAANEKARYSRRSANCSSKNLCKTSKDQSQKKLVSLTERLK